MATAAAGKKSGIRTFKQGEIIFNENDPAESLFIIQTGQIRLYRPKGRGFVDLAILRSGEVIGEMAYFDEKASRRSCSAAAIMTTEVIEISFKAFAKTMSGLNPWFKTIINTLADRLRKTNEKVKSLESNSVGFGQGGKVGDYVFFHSSDIVKLLSTMYLVFKCHADKKESFMEIHENKLKFYLLDVYNVNEVKWEEFKQLLRAEEMMEIGLDEDKLPKQMKVKNIDSFRAMLVFFNTQRVTEDAKKLQISDKCQTLLKSIMDQFVAKAVVDEKAEANITTILDGFKEKNIPISDEDLMDAISAGICDDILVGSGNVLSTTVNYAKLKKLYPCIKMMNAVKKINESKSQT
ncbi:MAG: cyclic nucleotide-binding domain-containing protein [Bacteriovoracaceae bacterium]|nr:cyclic nucleotide-binding domain-containing protein [Bacteriovoracaceae bacterium]